MVDPPPPAPPGPQWGPPAAPSPYGAPGSPPGYGGPAYGTPSYGTPRTDGMAVASLVLSILSFVVCPVLLAVVGLALGYGARGRIEASAGTLGGAGIAKAGRIIAWTNIALATVGVWALAIAFATR